MPQMTGYKNQQRKKPKSSFSTPTNHVMSARHQSTAGWTFCRVHPHKLSYHYHKVVSLRLHYLSQLLSSYPVTITLSFSDFIVQSQQTANCFMGSTIAAFFTSVLLSSTHPLAFPSNSIHSAVASYRAQHRSSLPRSSNYQHCIVIIGRWHVNSSWGHLAWHCWIFHLN